MHWQVVTTEASTQGKGYHANHAQMIGTYCHPYSEVTQGVASMGPNNQPCHGRDGYTQARIQFLVNQTIHSGNLQADKTRKWTQRKGRTP